MTKCLIAYHLRKGGIISGDENNPFQLTRPLREKYLDIWHEYVENSTDSAKFVHNMDKLEMAVQAKEYEFDGYSKQSLQVFLKSANDYIAKSEPDIVLEILQKVNDNSK